MAGRITLMGLPLDVVTEADVLATVIASLRAGRGGTVITPHLEILRRYCAEPALRPLVAEADLIVADGQPLVWASRIKGTPLPERVPGSDLVWSLAAECALHGRSVYLLGGAPGACADAERKLRFVYPGLRVVGAHSPPMGFERDAAALADARERVRTARPDVVFVALGFPKQERLIALLREDVPSAWFLGVGVSLSFLADHVRRAPDWVIRLGLEWLHRLLQEPRRLFGRYVRHGIPFGIRLLAHAMAARGRTREALLPSVVEPPAGAARVVFHHGALERARAREVTELLAQPRRRPR